ncbi:PAS domain S-box protein [Limnovirga soli]|uniref:histidine kinase n=1 Tax=Limnovirga soli TaxID=2656915 RepID=A0A8J8FE22_9BACT|nr:PAS domain S-box protein [Limnovirga soli]NNV56233.1 PAS domain S-box protein [Limnovirga soli]
MKQPLKLLLIEDNESDAALLIRQLEKSNYDVTFTRVESMALFEAAIGEKWDIIISDYRLPGFNGSDILNTLKQVDEDTPFILVSGTVGEEIAVSMMKAGANDYLMKGNLLRLGAVVKRELEDAADRKMRRKTEHDLNTFLNTTIDIIGITNEKGYFLKVNKAFTNTLGYTEKDIYAIPYIQFVHPDDKAATTIIAEKLFKGSIIESFINRYQAKNGSYKFIEWNATPSGDSFYCVGRDITTRILTDEALKESSILMLQAQKMSHMGNWQWDLTSDAVTWSEELFNIFGLDKTNFNPSFVGYLNLVHEEDKDRVKRLLQVAIEKKEQIDFEERIIRPNGEIRHLKSWGLVTLDEFGQPVKMFGACLDITENKLAEIKNKLAEESIKKERNLLKTLIDHLPNSIYVKDIKGRKIMANPVDLSFAGVSSEADMIGKKDTEIFNEEAGNSFYNDDLRVLQNGERIINKEEVFINNKGFTQWLLTSKVPLYDEQKNISGLLGIGTNITQLKAAEDKLRESENRLQSVLNNAPFSIWIKDLNRKYLMANYSYQNIMKLQELDLLGKTDDEILPADIAAISVETDNEVIDFQTPVTYEQTLCIQGVSYDLNIIKFVIPDEEGKPTAICGMATDITERKKDEARITESENKLSAYFNSSSDSIVLISNEYTILTFNKVYERFVKHLFDIQVTIGDDIRKYIHSTSLIDFHKDIQAALNGSIVQKEYQLPFEKNNGWVNFSVVPIQDKLKNVIGVALTWVDVDARKKAEEDIRNSEEKFRSLIHNISDIITLVDENGLILYESSSIQQVLGYTEYELIGTNVFDMLHPDDIVKTANEFKSLVKEHGYSPIVEFKYRSKSGKYLYMEAQGNNQLKNPAIKAIIISSRDVTARKQADEAIKEERNQLRTLINNLPDAIYIKDIKGRKIITNPVDMEIMGVKDEYEIIGKTDIEIFKDANGREGYWHDMQILHSGIPILNQEDVFINRKTGKPGYLLTSKLPLYNTSGEIIGLLGIGRDITERKIAENELRISNERYEYATKATSDAIWDWDIQTGNLYCGENFTILFGYDTTDSAKNIAIWLKNIHPEDAEGVINKIKALIKSKENSWTDEYRFRKTDRSYAYVQNKGIVIRDPEGKAVRMIGALQDVTDKKKSEEERKQLITELLKNNNELQQFSYITSHNLRAPLTNLISFVNLLDIEKITDDRSKKLISGFKNSTYQLNETLNDLIDILIIKKNTTHEYVEVNLTNTFASVTNSIKSLIKASKGSINANFSAANIVLFNKQYMESIFLNLITNAIKYAQPGRALILNISTHIHNGHIQLIFADNGSGLNMDKVKNKIFGLHQKFHRHPDSKGIGLYLVHAQITSLGGKIEIDSEENKGTTFTITFKQTEA